MIHRFTNAHFAHSHSPTKEQRLCFFAGANTSGHPLHDPEFDGPEAGKKKPLSAPELSPLPQEIVADIRKQLLDNLSEKEKTYGALEAEEKIKSTLHSVRIDMQEKFQSYAESFIWHEEETNAQNILSALVWEKSFYKNLYEKVTKSDSGDEQTTVVASFEDRLQSYRAIYDNLDKRFDNTTDESVQNKLKSPMRIYEKLMRSLKKRLEKLRNQTPKQQADYLMQVLQEKEKSFEEFSQNQDSRYLNKIDTSLSRTSEFVSKKPKSLIDEYFARNSAAIEQKLRESDIAEYSDNPEQMISSTINHLRAQFKQDVLALGKYQAPKGDAPILDTPIDESFNKTFEKYTRASMPFASEEEVQIVLSRGKPAAFCFGNEIHINIDNPQARNVTDRARIIAHELTHFELDKESGGIMGLRKITTLFTKLPEWNDMKLAIDRIWNTRNVVTGDRVPAFESDTDYLHEILAIAAAHRKAPYTDGKDQELKNLAVLVENALKHKDKQTAFLKNIVDRITKRTDDSFEEFDIIVRNAIGERMPSEELLKREWGKRVVADEPDDIREGARKEIDAIWADEQAKKVRTMNPGGAADNEVDETTNESKKKDTATAYDVKANSEKSLQKVQALRKALPTMQLSNFSDDAAHDAKTQGINAHTGADLDKIHAEGMKVADEYLTAAAADLRMVQGVATKIENWNNFTISEKAKLATEWNFPNASDYRNLAQLGSDVSSEALDNSKATKKSKQTILDDAAKHLKSLERPLKTIEDYNDAKRLRDANLEQYGKKKDFKSKLFGFLGQDGGAEWLCYYDIVKIFKIYQEAIVESYKAQQNVVTNRIAKDSSWFLDTFSYGQPIRQIINRQARSADSDETDKYKTYLEQEGFTYKELFTNSYGQSLLDQNRNNVNRVRAILDYGAKHAWLYDLDRYNPHNVYGIDYAKVFTTQAFKELVEENEGGKKKEESRGYDKVTKHPDIPLMIKDMKDELKKLNIFAIKGILKRIQEKGKLTHSNVWGMVTFINELRKNKDLISILDKGLLDDIGNIGIGESAWSLTQFKTQRNSFMNWRKEASSTDSETAFQKNDCYLFETIAHVEKKLRENFKAISNAQDIDEAISIILSGKTYEQDGKFISIFQDDKIFNNYRETWMKDANSTTSAAKTDDDFFSAEGSDVLLAGRGIIEELGTRDSTGRPTHEQKALNFFAAVFDRYDDLKKIDTTAAENFRREMHAKLKVWFKTRILANPASTNQFAAEVDTKNRHILLGLLRRGIIVRSEVSQGLLDGVAKAAGGAPIADVKQTSDLKKEYEEVIKIDLPVPADPFSK